MRDHIRREAAAQDASAAWFVVPLSIVAAALLAITLVDLPRAESPAPAAMPAAMPAGPVPAPSSEPLPIHHDHVQAF
jgi:hypothetical protein